jgi:hypothetical protein
MTVDSGPDILRLWELEARTEVGFAVVTTEGDEVVVAFLLVALEGPAASVDFRVSGSRFRANAHISESRYGAPDSVAQFRCGPPAIFENDGCPNLRSILDVVYRPRYILLRGSSGERIVGMFDMRAVGRVILLVVAIMSGIFSLLREVLQFVDPTRYPEKSLFFGCLRAACIVAFGLLWFEERRARTTAEAQLNSTKPRLVLSLGNIV